jgi:hypothetical protein
LFKQENNRIERMKTVYNLASLLIVALSCAVLSNAFVPQSALSTRAFARPTTRMHMGFMPEKERDKISRDSEPEDFFAT